MKNVSVFGLFIFFLVFYAWVRPSYGNEYSIQVDTAPHQQFGLFYPATYKFKIPAGTSHLAAQFKNAPEDSWNTLPEKTSTDTFNGIDVARFDYAGGFAYVSVRFDRSSERIYLRIVDDTGEPVTITFDSITKYYDNRKGAVSITLDDWESWSGEDAIFIAATDFLASEGLYFSVGVITHDVTWSAIQQQIDKHGDKIEIASHSIHHPCTASEYSQFGYNTEVIGSRDAIINNLTFPAHPYVPLWLEPCGYSDDTLALSIAAGNYLVTRTSSNDLYYGGKFTPWDSTLGRYGRSHFVLAPTAYPDNQQLLTGANSLFDQAMAEGGIYSIADHPYDGYWYVGSNLYQHFDYIKGRNDVWYVPFGQLYEYHYLQEMRGNLSIQESAMTSPVANFSARPVSGAPPLPVSFVDSSTGSITSWLWNFGDSTTSTLQNPTHVYTSAGSYNVTLTVTGTDGSDSKTQPNYITVNPVSPVADFSATPQTGTVPLSVSFTDSSVGSITGWLWDFGDSTTSTQQNPSHVYNSAGSYTVTLTVTGSGGSNSKTQTAYIVVGAGGPVANFTATPQTGTAPLSVS
ncbi:MAG TPA: PKD domain-containing protein, partial [Geomonas sp.]|nr:PKD domain-containing protein [Geomonas sp.]